MPSHTNSPDIKDSVDTMHVRNLIIGAGQDFWDVVKPEAVNEMKKDFVNTTGTIIAGGLKPTDENLQEI